MQCSSFVEEYVCVDGLKKMCLENRLKYVTLTQMYFLFITGNNLKKYVDFFYFHKTKHVFRKKKNNLHKGLFMLMQSNLQKYIFFSESAN